MTFVSYSCYLGNGRNCFLQYIDKEKLVSSVLQRMDDKYSTDSAGFDPDESDPGDTGSVQHPNKHVRQKSLANLSSAQLNYQHLGEESDEEDGPDGKPKEIVTVGEDAGMHMLAVREIGHDDDIDPGKQLSEAARIDRLVRNTVESVLDGPGTVALRVNDHVLDRRGQVDPATTAALKDKMSTSAMIIMHKETHVHRWRCCVM